MLRGTVQESEGSREVVKLTPRERSVLRLYCNGLSSKQIGGKLGLTTSTVDFYLRQLARDVRVAGRRELPIWAYQNQGCFVPETWVETGLHPQPCACHSVFCTAMRVAGNPDALEEYRKQRDEKRAAENQPPEVPVSLSPDLTSEN